MPSTVSDWHTKKTNSFGLSQFGFKSAEEIIVLYEADQERDR